MKFILCVIAIFAALQNVDCGVSTREVGMELIKRYQELRQTEPSQDLKSLFDRICPAYSHKLQNATIELKNCENILNESEETICSIAKNDVKRCLSPIITLLEECLPIHANPIPALFLDIGISATNYLCRIDGERIFELMNPCMVKLNFKSDGCFRLITSKVEEYKRTEELPSARSICESLKTLRPCLQSQLIGSCKNRITQEANLGLFDELMKPCKKYENNETDPA